MITIKENSAVATEMMIKESVYTISKSHKITKEEGKREIKK